MFKRGNGELVWSLARGLPDLKSPVIFDLDFYQCVQDDIKTRVTKKLANNYPTGDVYQATLKPQGRMEDWLDGLFEDPNTSMGLVKRWQVVNMCEETGTLVFCCNGILCLLKNYKLFFQDTSKDPEWFAAYRFQPLTHEVPTIGDSVLEQERRWMRNVRKAETSLSVQSGRALWVSALPFLLDWRSAKSVGDIKVNMLWQDYECHDLVRKLDSYNIGASTPDSVPKHA